MYPILIDFKMYNKIIIINLFLRFSEPLTHPVDTPPNFKAEASTAASPGPGDF